MSTIYISFNLKSISSSIESTDVLETNYQAVYKPLAKFLYSHPEFGFTFSFSGNQINFFKRKRKEFLTIVKQLVEKKQVEVLGGGYYDPVLPLIFSVDRNGQIDMMSTEIRQTIGKRPRGMSVFADCWDSSLVSSLINSGIEYVLLESSLVATDKRTFLPLIMSDLSKSIDIFPYYDNLIPSTNITPEDYIHQLKKSVDKIQKKEDYFQFIPERIVNVSLSHGQLLSLLESNWFEKLYDYLNKNSDLDIKLSTTDMYRKNAVTKIPAYIPAGINGSIAKWIKHAYQETDSKQNDRLTVYDFMDTYPQCRSLYNRILYVSMLVNQYKHDKMRKNDARQKLWKAQNGTGLLCTSKGAFSNSKYRQQSYKTLMEAEKLLREDKSFKESILSFDYNGDGLNEYVCRMQNYFTYITLISGAVQELDILKNTGNYADNLSRVIEYDKCLDDYERGLFIDHYFTKDQFDRYLTDNNSNGGIFSKVQYSELKFSQSHHEITLFAEVQIPNLKQKIYLRKKYIINSTGMIVQYILRNESNTKLNGIFAIENNFAHTNFDADDIFYYNLEVVENDEIVNIDTKKSTTKINKKGKLSKVNVIRLTDSESGISFGFEPNENCGFYFSPLVFNRPDFNNNDPVPVAMTFINTLFWNVDIEPGKEIEKTINFTITSVKKEKRKN